jgi:hypothetical protein
VFSNLSSAFRSRFKFFLTLSSATWLFAGCGGAADTRPAKWSFISASIIQPSCATANCHSKISQRSGVELDDIRVGFDQIVNRHFVIPMNADSSALPALLRAQGSRRMPPDFPLPDVDIALIEAWINAGALWDGPGAAPVAALSIDAGP